jgi:hypothetical protein
MPFATSVVLFVYFGLTGFAFVSALNTRRDLVRNALIAPAAGVALNVSGSYAASRLGVPAEAYAQSLAAAALALGAILLLLRPPVIPFRHVLPYVPIVALAFLAAGWPLLIPGAAWLGSSNPDFTNFVLDAERLARNGYLATADASTWERQSDWSAYFVGFAATGARTGAQLLLSFVMSLLNKTAVEAYMPLLLAAHASLVTAAAGLITVPHRYARLAAAGVLSVTAMLALGVVLQLLAQVIGLALLALACALCLTPFWRLEVRHLCRWVALAGLTLAACVISYPEAIPFLFLAFVVHHATAAREARRFAAAMALAVTAATAMAAVLLAPEVPGLARYLLNQAQQSTRTASLPRLFPYFLVPSGVPSLFGLIPYVPRGGFLVAGAVAGAAPLLLGCLAAMLWQLRSREPAAAVLAVMTGIAPVLFAKDAGFGLFKLAMYVQPFLIPTATLSLCRALRATR